MNWPRWTIGTVAISILALTLAGCGGAAPPSSPSSSGSSSAASTNPLEAAGTAVVALPPGVILNDFGPIMGNGTGSTNNGQTISLRYKHLVYISPTDTIDFARSLASSITVSNNDQTFTVTLNPKWHWSNGRPVTAADVLFSAEVQMASCGPGTKLHHGCGTGGLNALGTVSPDGVGWMSVSAPNATTFVVTVNKPVNPVWFEHNGLGQLIPFPARVWQQAAGVPAGAPLATATKDVIALMASVIGNPVSPVYQVVDGPFKFQSMVPTDYWEFVPNPSYDGHKATIKHLIYQYFTTSTAEFAALKKGTIGSGYLSSYLYSQRNIPGYKFALASPIFGVNYIVLNMSPSAPGGIGLAFQDLQVRKALQYGIDEQAYIQIVGGGYGTPQYNPLPTIGTTAIYNAKAMPAPYSFNPATGKALLIADGWTMQNGVMTKTINGKSVALKFTLYYGSGDPALQNFFTLQQHNWAQEGIQMTPTPMPFNAQLGLFDAAGGSVPSQWAANIWGGWSYEPDYYPTGGELFGPGSYNNAGDFSNPTLTRLMYATNAPGTPAQAYARMTAYAAEAQTLLPVLYVGSIDQGMNGGGGLYETATYLHGVPSSYNVVNAQFSPNYWTISVP